MDIHWREAARSAKAAVRRGGRGAHRGAQAVGDLVARLTVAYWNRKENIDPYAIGIGSGLILTGVASDMFHLGFGETLAVGALGGAATMAAEPLAAAITQDDSEARASTKTAAVYAAAGAMVTGAGAFVLAGEPSLSEILRQVPHAGGATLGGHLYLRHILPVGQRIKEMNQAPHDPERRRFVLNALRAGSTLAAVTSTAGGLFYGIDAILSRGEPIALSEERVPPTFARWKGERVLEISALADDSYSSIANDLLIDSVGGAAPGEFLARFNDGDLNGRVYVPVRALKEELRDLESTGVTDFLSADRPTLWSLAGDYLAPPGMSVPGSRRQELIRVMQRLSHQTNPTVITAAEPIIIPRGYIYAGRLDPETLQRRFETSLEGDTGSIAPPPTNANLAVNDDFMNLNATVERRRPLARNGRQGYGDIVPIDKVILHTTESSPQASDLDVVQYVARRQLSHYVIGRDGTLYMTVDPRFFAWHAGDSLWEGERDVSYSSIGVEIIAHSDGPDVDRMRITDAQYETLRNLSPRLQTTYEISPQDFLGHVQVAYEYDTRIRGRRKDPGPEFDWRRAGLPDNYSLRDPDVLAGRVQWNSHAARTGRMPQGGCESFEGASYMGQGRCQR